MFITIQYTCPKQFFSEEIIVVGVEINVKTKIPWIDSWECEVIVVINLFTNYCYTCCGL